MVLSVCVLGAGVVGLTTAVSLLRSSIRVKIVTESRGRLTCSGNAGAIWGPFLSSEDSRLLDWSLHTLEILRRLAENEQSGVSVVEGLLAADHETAMPTWFKLLGQDHSYYGKIPDGYVECWRYAVPIIDMPKYLSWLESEFRRQGGIFAFRKIFQFDEISEDFDFIVNCTGLGAAELCRDDKVHPIKGQLIILDNPGFQHFFAERGSPSDLFYWMPQGKKIVLGGTAETTFSHRGIDQHQVDRILRKATVIDRRFRSAQLIDTRVGFRPCRETVRLGHDEVVEKIIHNYGHGGSGVSVSWGCARDVTKLILEKGL